MPVKHSFNIYREQLWPLYHGFALWRPNPVEGIYNQVSIGDVGYIHEGGFIRMFNVTLPRDDQSNKSLGEPWHYDPLGSDSFAIRRETFGKIDYYSRRVSREENVGNTQAASPDDAECVTYRCRGRGALLSLPNGGLRQDVIHRKVFQKYIGDNVATWFEWAKNKGLPVDSMEDPVFVYGCTLVTSWAAAAFDDYTGNAQLSLASRTPNNGGACFTWSNIRGTVDYHDSQLNPNIPHLPQNRCVFIKCLRAKRVFFWRTIRWGAPFPQPIGSDDVSDNCILHDEVSHNNLASHDNLPDDEASNDTLPDDGASHNALPDDEASNDTLPVDGASHAALPDDEASHDGFSDNEASHRADEAPFHASAAPVPYDPNNRQGSVMYSTEVPDDPKYLDPLIGILNYIMERKKHYPGNDMPWNTTAIAQDDDLQLIERMDSLTGDAVENFLHETKMKVLLDTDCVITLSPDTLVDERRFDEESSD